MKHRLVWTFLAAFVVGTCANLAAAQKPRVVGAHRYRERTGRRESMVRFLIYSNQWDVEGLVATTSVHQRDKTAAWRIRQIVEAYGKVRDNLRTRAGLPETAYLLSIIREGRPAFGMAAVGEGKDSPGSELIIQAWTATIRARLGAGVGRSQLPRAGALEGSRHALARRAGRFVSRLRVYTISDQDDSGPWIRKTSRASSTSPAPEFMRAARITTPPGAASAETNFTAVSPAPISASWTIPGWRKTSAARDRWANSIRSEVPDGRRYADVSVPHRQRTRQPGASRLGRLGRPLRVLHAAHRKWFQEPETRPFWSDAEDEVLGVDGEWHQSNKATIWRWRSAYQNDFAARMDWTIKPYAEANHPPVAKLAHPANSAFAPASA